MHFYGGRTFILHIKVFMFVVNTVSHSNNNYL
jgi:hypothetical protein